MKSLPFLLYSFLVVLTFIPVAVIGLVAETASFLQSAISFKSKEAQGSNTEFAIY